MTDESEKTPSGDENESEINQAINKPFSDGHTLCILNLYIVGRPTFFFFWAQCHACLCGLVRGPHLEKS